MRTAATGMASRSCFEDLDSGADIGVAGRKSDPIDRAIAFVGGLGVGRDEQQAGHAVSRQELKLVGLLWPTHDDHRAGPSVWATSIDHVWPPGPSTDGQEENDGEERWQEEEPEAAV